MLFDLRGKGRRRTVQVTYTVIALLFLFTFIFVGIGTGLSGNINFFEAVGHSGNEGGSSYGAAVKKAHKRTEREPNSAAAWAALVEAQLRQASEARYTNVNSNAGGFTAEGKKYLVRIADSWERYLALEAKNPSVLLAKRMASVLGEEGLNRAAATVQALEIAVAAEPDNAGLYGALAQYAYQANNVSQGDLAAEKALALTPQSERAHLKGVLNSFKKSASSSSTVNLGGGASATTGSGTKSGH